MTGKASEEDSARKSSAGTETNGSGQSSTRPGSTGGSGQKDGSDEDQAGAAGGGEGKGDGAAGAGEKQGEDRQGVAPLTPAPSSSADGSSPLVPILIALAVLAAISVGVVAMRKKREDVDPGAPASTEAG